MKAKSKGAKVITTPVKDSYLRGWDEGYEASRKNKPETDNPHPADTKIHDGWVDGWLDAEFEPRS